MNSESCLRQETSHLLLLAHNLKDTEFDTLQLIQ